MARSRRAIALLALLALVAGLPAVLAVTVGYPLGGWPTLLAGDVSDAVVIDVLATVAYAAWGQFAVAVLGEGLAAMRGQPLSRPIPGVFAAQQHLARALVSAVLALGPVGTSVVAIPAIATAASPVATVSAAVSVHGPDPAPGAIAKARSLSPRPAYVVPEDGGSRTYWDLAVAHLGSGERWEEIWDLNRGRIQPDGTAMTAPGLLRSGWTVVMPADAVGLVGRIEGGEETSVRVEPDDTLSGISAREGVPDWTATWRANAGREQPHGERFTNPHLIKPGWTIDVPAAPVDMQPVPPTPQSHAPVASADPVPRAPRTADAGSPADTDRCAGTAEQSAVTLREVFAGGGVLLAAGVLAALLAHRRRQFRYRRPGRTIGATPAGLAPVEKAVLIHGTAGAADVAFLDHALRSLVHAVVRDGTEQLPDVVAARLQGDLLELHLERPHATTPPAPWSVDYSGCRWTVTRNDVLPADARNAEDVLAPYPALVAVGYDAHGAQWLLDLERAGAIVLTGDVGRCLDLGRFIAAELAVNAWSEQLSATLAGFGAELVPLHPERLSYVDDPSSAASLLGERRQHVLRQCHASGHDVLAARTPEAPGEAWMPHVLLVAPDAAESPAVAELLVAMREVPERSAVAVVLAGADRFADVAARHVTVSADGRLSIPALGLDLVAQQLPADQVPDLVALLQHMRAAADEPIPASSGTRSWEAFADAAGALRPELSMPRAPERPDGPGDHAEDIARATHDEAASVPLTASVLPQAQAIYLEHAATAVEDLEALAPRVPAEVRGKVRDADPELDGDLAAWRDTQNQPPRLRLLGPVHLCAAGTPPDKRQPFYTEIVAYLATRDGGVTVAHLAEALWPDEPGDKRTTARRAVHIARKWLGINPRTGQWHLPEATESQRAGGIATYTVEDVLVDADLFRRLRVRGESRGADGIADLEAALDLVAGVPFDQRRPRGYAWLVDNPLDHIYTAAILDVAHLVATHALANDEPARARTAAEIALRTGAHDDQALLDLVAVCSAEGNRAAATSYVRRIMANHDAEVEEDLPPRTYEILRRHSWLEAS
jgi:DNA-binding SARP family transcriptional activator